MIATRIKHKIIYTIGRLIIPFKLNKYDFSTDVFSGSDENYLIMSNHLTEVDLFILAAAFKKQMYFVAGEHLLRSKHGKFMKWIQDPIYEAKGAPTAGTLKEIVKRIKQGCNVMIFPEGSRSFNGETIKLPDSAAKMVKLCNCGLITYHIEGGYFVAPRWAYEFRTGPIHGNIVKIRSASEISGMSVSELTEAINNELYENAYETQRKKHYKYTGQRLAEGLENYLIKCPSCGEFDSLVSKGNDFCCKKCGLSGSYTDEGFLTGEGLKYDSVYDWGKWAEEETESYIRSVPDDEICFMDDDIVLSEIGSDHVKRRLYEGSITGYKDRFVIGDMPINISSIQAVSMLYFGKSLLFTCDKGYFEVTGDNFHAIKYQKIYDCYKKMER